MAGAVLTTLSPPEGTLKRRPRSRWVTLRVHNEWRVTFRLLADIGMRALSPAVNDPATAVQVLDTTESLLQVLVSRDLDVADIADGTGTVRVVLALPSWDDYLRIALDDLIESASQSPMVLLRARALLTTLLDAAPPARQPPITRRLQRAEDLGAGNFPVIWHDAAGAARRSSSATDQPPPAP